MSPYGTASCDSRRGTTPTPAQTDAAAVRVKELLSSRPEAVGVRLGVKQRECRACRLLRLRCVWRIARCLSWGWVADASILPPSPPAHAGGCNGISFTMNYAEAKKVTDEEVSEKGVRVFIEPSALMKVVGTTMDWKEDALSAEFVFANPNAKSVCGCGESFNV